MRCCPPCGREIVFPASTLFCRDAAGAIVEGHRECVDSGFVIDVVEDEEYRRLSLDAPEIVIVREAAMSL